MATVMYVYKMKTDNWSYGHLKKKRLHNNKQRTTFQSH